jgi:hypothetical protein
MNARLERYLEEVAHPVSAERRTEWIEETRQHLEQLATSYEELGMEHDVAVEAALRSFGEAREVGRAVERETQRASSFLSRVAGPVAGLIAAALIAPTLYVLSLLLIWQSEAMHHAANGLLALLWSLIAGPVIWMRRTAPGRAAAISGGIYLAASAAIVTAFCLRESPVMHQQGDSFPMSVVPNLVATVAFVGLQGGLVGGTVAIVREWCERHSARWRMGKV